MNFDSDMGDFILGIFSPWRAARDPGENQVRVSIIVSSCTHRNQVTRSMFGARQTSDPGGLGQRVTAYPPRWPMGWNLAQERCRRMNAVIVSMARIVSRLSG